MQIRIPTRNLDGERVEHVLTIRRPAFVSSLSVNDTDFIANLYLRHSKGRLIDFAIEDALLNRPSPSLIEMARRQETAHLSYIMEVAEIYGFEFVTNILG